MNLMFSRRRLPGRQLVANPIDRYCLSSRDRLLVPAVEVVSA